STRIRPRSSPSCATAAGTPTQSPRSGRRASPRTRRRSAFDCPSWTSNDAHSMTIDVEAVRAIDVHTHAQVPLNGPADLRTNAFLDAAAKHFRSDFPRPNAQQVAEHFRARSMAAVIFCVENQHNTGEVPVSNDEILDVAAASSDVLIPFVSVDPHRENAAAEARRLIG